MWMHQRVQARGLEFHVVTAGPERGPPVVLLHGFPEMWLGWRKQIDALASAGFRVVVFDQRGYGESDRPTEVQAYRRTELAADVVAVMRRLGHERFSVVGHDWGGIVAWDVASWFEAHVDRLGVLNAPHGDLWRKSIRRNPKQLARSAYVLFFRVPGLAEQLLGAKRAAAMWSLARRAPGGAFDEAVEDAYRDAWSRPGALRAMLSWYRARQSVDEAPRIRCRTLVLWGSADPAIELSLARRSVELCDRGALRILDGASHFIQHEAADVVNEALASFLDGVREGRSAVRPARAPS